MSSIRSQILAAMKSALDAPEKPAGLSVHRTKTRPITADKLPAIVIYRLQEPTRAVMGGSAISPSGDSTCAASAA
jgi:hypothetical protein